MLGKFTRKEKTNCGLDLPTCDGGPLVVVSESGSLSCDSPKDVVDKAVHDGHDFAGNTSVWVHLFQYFVDVDAVRFLLLPPFLVC